MHAEQLLLLKSDMDIQMENASEDNGLLFIFFIFFI